MSPDIAESPLEAGSPSLPSRSRVVYSWLAPAAASSKPRLALTWRWAAPHTCGVCLLGRSQLPTEKTWGTNSACPEPAQTVFLSLFPEQCRVTAICRAVPVHWIAEVTSRWFQRAGEGAQVTCQRQATDMWTLICGACCPGGPAPHPADPRQISFPTHSRSPVPSSRGFG